MELTLVALILATTGTLIIMVNFAWSSCSVPLYRARPAAEMAIIAEPGSGNQHFLPWG